MSSSLNPGLLLVIVFLITQCASENRGEKIPEETRTAGKVEVEDSVAPKPQDYDQTALVFPYDLSKWKLKAVLGKGLEEISALEYHESRNEILAVNDEEGILYTLDPENGEILNRRDFGKSGDYEGVALFEEMVYIVKNNGTLYALDLSDTKEANKINTPLTKTNDVEGLCLDAANKCLLLACKGSPDLEKHNRKKGSKAIYAYDLYERIIKEEPTLLIEDDDLEDFVKANFQSKAQSKKQLEKLIDRATKISPSAIAIHPLSDQFYVLSTVGKLLLVCNRNGTIAHIEFLDDNQHVQPEGICFKANGDLYISNEGRGFSGTIFKYEPL